MLIVPCNIEEDSLFSFVRELLNVVFVASGIWKCDPEEHVLRGKEGEN